MDRQNFVDAALSVVDLGANPNDADRRQSYIDLIAPGESLTLIHDMLNMSGCGLTVAGIWRKAGVVHYKLNPPYIIGTGISRLTTLAMKYDAWVPFKKDVFPQPGDMVLIGDNGSNGTEHVYTITEVNEENGTLQSVDGGQHDYAGCQTIIAKNRVWQNQLDRSYVGIEVSKTSSNRKIMGWIDVEKLPSE